MNPIISAICLASDKIRDTSIISISRIVASLYSSSATSSCMKQLPTYSHFTQVLTNHITFDGNRHSLLNIACYLSSLTYQRNNSIIFDNCTKTYFSFDTLSIPRPPTNLMKHSRNKKSFTVHLLKR